MSVDPQSQAAMTGVVGAVVSLAGTGVTVAISRRWGLLDVPNERSSHSLPTPRMGGVALSLGLAVAVLFTWEGTAAWLPVMLACAIGLRDDRKPMKPAFKMAGLLLVASIPVALGSTVLRHVSGVPFAARVDFGVLAVPLTLLWLGCYPNAFNFMDGLNGIASLSAAVAGVAFAMAGVIGNDMCLAAWGGAVAGASLGFVPWNFPIARTFMGDGGSLPLGLLIAMCAVQAQRSHALSFPASVLLLGPFLFDVAFTLVRRTVAGERLGEAHKEHLYQRLSRHLGSHAKVSLLYASLAAVTGALALAYDSMSDVGKLLSLVLPLVAMLGFARSVRAAEDRKAR